MEMNGKHVDPTTGRQQSPIEQMFGSADKIPRCHTCPNFDAYEHGASGYCRRDPVTVEVSAMNYCASHPFHAAAHMRVLNAIMRHAEQISPTLASRIIKPGT